MLMKHQKIYMTMFLRKEIFSANLLDVPVGTAVFTENKWSSLKNAHITCIDYSMDMLEQARKRLGSHAHIKCIQRKRYWQRLP